MGVTEKTLGSKAFLENGSLTGAVGGGSGGGMFEEDVMKERKVRVAMDKRVDRDSDRGSRGTAVREEETPAQQNLLKSAMSPHTSCEGELQGSNAVLVRQSFDGGGSTGYLADGEGPGRPMVLEGEEEEKGPLRNKMEFLLLCASLAIGTRNVIQYPSLALKHGGGAFTFVYVLLTGVLGLPLLYLEISLGQYARGGPVSAWKITPLSNGLGYSMMIVSALVLLYSTTYTAWAVYYLFSSFSFTLPWHPHNMELTHLNATVSQLVSMKMVGSENSTSLNNMLHSLLANISGNGTNDEDNVLSVFPGYFYCQFAQNFFYQNVLNASKGLGELGSIQGYLSLCLLVVWIAISLALMGGPISMSKVAYVTGTVPLVLLVMVLGAFCSLGGSVIGLRALLTPRWAALAGMQVWWDAAKLVLNGFACGTGMIISLSAWAHFHSKCFRNSLIITGIAVATTLVGGGAVCAGLGAQLLLDPMDIKNLQMTAVDLAFGIIPSVTAWLPFPPLWCGLWFLLLVLGGVGVQGALLHNLHQSINTLACAKHRHAQLFLLIVLLTLLFMLGLCTITQGGLYIVQLLEHSVFLLCIPVVCLAEVISLMWLYGVQRFANRISDMTGATESFLWKWMWKFLCPVVLLGCIILSVMTTYSYTPSSSLSPSLSSTSLLSSLWLLISQRSVTTRIPYSMEASFLQLSSPSPTAPTSVVEFKWALGVAWFLTCLPLLPPLSIAVYLFSVSPGSFRQRLKVLVATPRDWGPRHLEHEPQFELPDYVICSPDVYRPANALALLTANLYLPNLSTFLSIEKETREACDVAGGYLSDLMTVTSSEDDSGEEENKMRGNWGGRFEFVFTCLGYVVGLGNIWRFPYLVYRNGGGAFFIAYLVMLVFVGIPLVFMELAFGQFASLGPITVWKAAPLFKGVGYTMVLISGLVAIYYNMVTAWAFHYLFTSLTSRLPWGFCNNSWNTDKCTTNKYAADNCSVVNQTILEWPVVQNQTHCHAVLSNCSAFDADTIGNCISTLRDLVGDDAIPSYQKAGSNYTTPSEEYFYLTVLDVSGSLDRLGSIKWQMVMCLLLCWLIVFVCLLRGIKTAGKVSYVVVLVPYVAVLVLLIRAVSMSGSSKGVHFYTTPKWELLRQPRMWGDAAAQVFFSLSVCWGGLTTLASYNKFNNNVYRDALLVCVGDTLNSVLAGFAVFAMIGVLSEKLGSSVQDVIQSDLGMTFIIYPAALLSFPVPSLWSVLFFLMLVTMGLGTTFCTIETVITAIMDENPAFFKKRRVAMLSVVCLVSFLLGLPLTAQGGFYLLQLMDEYLSGFPLMIAGMCLCLGIAWVYGLQQFCKDIEHMIKSKVGLWWRVMWSAVCPMTILFTIISSAIGYQPLGQQFDFTRYPWWSETLGFLLVAVSLLPIVVWPLYKISQDKGTLIKRIHLLCQPVRDWGPALEKNWNYVEYFPAVQTNLLAVELDHPPLNTITGKKADMNYALCWDHGSVTELPNWKIETGQEWMPKTNHMDTLQLPQLRPSLKNRVEFTTVGVPVPSASQSSLLPAPVTQQLPNGARAKVGRPLDMRQKAILNHAYSNPQCHVLDGSVETLSHAGRISSNSDGALNDVIVTPRVRIRPIMKDVSTQTDVSCFERIKRQVSEPIGRATTPTTPPAILTRSMSWMQEGEPAVIEVEISRF